MKRQRQDAAGKRWEDLQPSYSDLPLHVRERDRLITELFSLTAAQGQQAWAYLANCLFFAIARHEGQEIARGIFDQSGPMPKRLRTALRNAALLGRLRSMRPKPNVAKLARELAEENKNLPKEQRRGAGGTDPGNLEDHIRDLVEAHRREARRRHGAQADQLLGPLKSLK